MIASATIAYLIGIGGLGYFIFAGLPLSRYDLLLVGAIPVAILAFAAELLLSAVQRSFRYQLGCSKGTGKESHREAKNVRHAAAGSAGYPSARCL